MSLGSEHLGPDSKQALDAGLTLQAHTRCSDCAFNKLVIWPGQIAVAAQGLSIWVQSNPRAGAVVSRLPTHPWRWSGGSVCSSLFSVVLIVVEKNGTYLRPKCAGLT